MTRPHVIAGIDRITRRLIALAPHLWTRTLCDELEDLGYAQS